jgi:lysophospholipase L1-like esterase
MPDMKPLLLGLLGAGAASLAVAATTVAPDSVRFEYTGVPPRVEAGMARWQRPSADAAAAHPATSIIGFRTAANAVTIRLRYPTPPPRRRLSNGVVLVDGVPEVGFTRPGDGPGDVRVELSWPEARQRDLQVVLPAADEVQFLGLELSPAGVQLAVSRPSMQRPIVAMGDGITQGFSASHPLYTWPARLGRALGRPWVNLGYDGRATVPADADGLGALKPAAVAILLGSMDAQRGTDPRVFTENYLELLRRILRAEPEFGVWAVTPLPCDALGGRWRLDRIEEYREAIRTAVREANDPRIRLVEGPELTPFAAPEEFRALYPDALHPNDDAFRRMAESLTERMRADGFPAAPDGAGKVSGVRGQGECSGFRVQGSVISYSNSNSYSMNSALLSSAFPEPRPLTPDPLFSRQVHHPL